MPLYGDPLYMDTCKLSIWAVLRMRLLKSAVPYVRTTPIRESPIYKATSVLVMPLHEGFSVLGRRYMYRVVYIGVLLHRMFRCPWALVYREFLI